MTLSAPMESADQTARAGGRVSTTMVVLARPPSMQPDQLTPLVPMTSSCRSLYMSFLDAYMTLRFKYVSVINAFMMMS